MVNALKGSHAADRIALVEQGLSRANIIESIRTCGAPSLFLGGAKDPEGWTPD